MTTDEISKLASMVERADLIMLAFGDKKAGLGADIQERIVRALRLYAVILQWTEKSS